MRDGDSAVETVTAAAAAAAAVTYVQWPSQNFDLGDHYCCVIESLTKQTPGVLLQLF